MCASKRRLHRKQCTNKKHYPMTDSGWRQAVGASKLLARETGGMTDAFRCVWCHSGYVVGHAPKKVRQAIAARRGE
jgi:hypothetical protein